jgi:YidC/Oxa1 family membrane protein insertase
LAEYRNPQQEPGGGDKRMLMVFAITFALIILSQIFLFKKNPATQPPTSPPQTSQSTPPAAQSPAGSASAQAANQPNANAPKPTVASKSASGEMLTVVENNFYSITFTNNGAKVKSWVLKGYKDDHGNPLDLVNKQAAEKFGFPLSMYTYDEKLGDQINKKALYVPSATGKIEAPGELTFEYAAGGLAARKSYIFGAGYAVSVETAVTQDGKAISAYPMWPAGLGDQTTAAAYASERIEHISVSQDSFIRQIYGWFRGDTVFVDGTAYRVQRLNPKEVSGGNTLQGPFNWAGSQDQFFAAIFLPDSPNAAAMVTLHNAIREAAVHEVLGAAVGDTNGVTKERLFVGPKSLNVLESVRSNSAPGQMTGPDLRDVVDFGFFSLIARPLFLWLKWTQQHMASNWGVAIIILTVIINAALLPLRIVSMKSALKMQKLQPQMKAIQERYKKYPMRDPKRQEMNAEISELYKREGVNPAGGCLPLIIQMPFLFAFYSMLANAIELRQAPFLWLHDLSSPDKLFIMPVVIVVSTYLMQKMTPSSGMDPKQQQMMTLMMPLMIGWFSFNLPSGLSVYWTVGNIIGIGQQYIMNRSGLGREMREEMEKRARKKASK